MSKAQSCRSALLYENSARTLMLIDIPTSIALAQRLQQLLGKGENPANDDGLVLLSCPPLQDPYPNPPEPKTEEARSRVLAQIPASQQQFHAAIVPIINNALQEIRDNHHGAWCSPRCTRWPTQPTEQEPEKLREDARCTGIPSGEPSENRKRKLPETTTQETGPDEPSFIIEHTELRPHRSSEPPLILAPGINTVESLGAIQGRIVQNPSSAQVILHIKSEKQQCTPDGESSLPDYISINVPPKSTFVNCHLAPNAESRLSPILPLSSDTKFDFILMDPPWPNRSVRRSSHYKEHADPLQPIIESILQNHLHPHQAIVAIWITNSLKSRSVALNSLKTSGLHPFEEWIWVKTTVDGRPAAPPDGLWRRPYEVLILAHKEKHFDHEGNADKSAKVYEAKRRVIVAVPDVHSRKPNLKGLIEDICFSSPTTDSGQAKGPGQGRRIREYSALEVFARNLTAGWWGCGDEVIRFNWKGWWNENGSKEVGCSA
ncbi:hypothetical protein PAAG_02253 [Paracoccidioides lutzii Pb01]|uniref:MT-A70 family n=1 Tax=Paracoccidioides lutzii (strain ATCC MYA-826 / Pb01) TaxID=502779 RepID=C1GVH6_PARBA|nr:hypothetical protein PAAG_02253 [Paracoccidioides lutzii Pb01]EEH40198.1 hypothetical protein PAAG_02253 [Paracoccidioides lutzii Pb01]